MKKLSEEQTELNVDVDTETLKEKLKYLVDNEQTLIKKIGFLPNQVNKKTKNVKKANDNSGCYELDSQIFSLDEGDKCMFDEVVNYLVTEHFNKLSVREKEYEQFLKVIVEYSKQKGFGESPAAKKQQAGNSLLNYVFKSIDWLILFYILVCFYNFLIN
jgi:restriction endonuclease Mrr